MAYLIRSTLIVGTLYFVLFTLLWLIHGYLYEMELYTIVLVPIWVILMDYLVSPWILFIIFRIEWIDHERLRNERPQIAQFIEKTVKKYHIKFPHIGIIHEGTPNAFCFGWTRNSARLVITDGIFEYLNEQEQISVVAHEMGHIVHNDFVVMTMVSAIPILFYSIFRILIQAGGSGGGGDGAALFHLARFAIALFSWIMYIVGCGLSLLISRYREYWADEFSAYETQNPNGLATGLVKIAYGILQISPQDGKKQKPEDKNQYVRALGIFDGNSAKQVAYTATNANGEIDKEIIAKAASWDLYQPWAKIMELLSTHPLPAKRILKLEQLAQSSFNQRPIIDLSSAEQEYYKQMGKSGWYEFFTEVLILFAPKMAFFTWTIMGIVLFATQFNFETLAIPHIHNFWTFFLGSFVFAGIFQLLQNIYKYNGKFEEHTILDLVGTIRAGPIRPIPTRTKGRVIGRGVPGLFLSEDVFIQDTNGIMYIDYDFGINLINKLFAIFKIEKLFGEDVEIVGWYRRSPAPYIQVHRIRTLTGEQYSYGNFKKAVWNILGIFYILLGIGLIFVL